MKNITGSVDDETYRNARTRAAELDTSVSALVKRYLAEVGSSESEFEHLERLEREVRARIVGFSAAHNVSRDELHERDA